MWGDAPRLTIFGASGNPDARPEAVLATSVSIQSTTHDLTATPLNNLVHLYDLFRMSPRLMLIDGLHDIHVLDLLCSKLLSLDPSQTHRHDVQATIEVLHIITAHLSSLSTLIQDDANWQM
jgi:hypothetical protein